MCLIIASPSGRKPEFSVFEDAARTNSHGIGLAWRVKDRVLFKKGLTLDELKTIMESVKDEWVAHFRIATIGDKIPELTHPFVVSNESPLVLEGEADSVLFQNGTYSSWDTELLRACASAGIRLPDGEWSDSRATAVLVSIYGRNILRFLGNHSRYCLLSSGDKKKPDLADKVWYTGTWHKHDESGLHLSNMSSSLFDTRTTFPRREETAPLDRRAADHRAAGGSGRRNSDASDYHSPASTTRRARRQPGGRSPWQFFTNGAGENDGVAESLGLSVDTSRPLEEMSKNSIEHST